MSPSSNNSFGSRDTLAAGGHSYEIYRLDALEKRGIGHGGQLPFSLRVLLENLLRQEDGRFVQPEDIEALAEWQPVAKTRDGDCLHAGARAAAGFHRRACRGRSGGDARRHRAHGRRREEDQSPAAGRAGDRPFRAGGQVRQRHGVRVQRGTRVPAQRRALRVPALGAEGVAEFQGGAAGHGHRAPGEPGISGARGLRRLARRPRGGLSRFAGGHRFAHHDGQRSGRFGLGRRRHRSRGAPCWASRFRC